MDQDSLKILCIEDDTEDFLITKNCLQESGILFTIEHAKSCEEAKELLALNVYDVCFLDYIIGDCTGLNFLQEIGAFGHKTPFILLTGQNDRQIDRSAMELGASDYLLKENIEPFLLERTIRHAIERKRFESQIFEIQDELTDALKEIKDHQKKLIEIENLRSVKELAGAVAHEFAQPLQALSNYLSLIKTGVDNEKFIGKSEMVLAQIVQLTQSLRNITGITKKDYLDTQILDFTNQKF